MPPRTKVNKEDIIKACFELVRKNGIDYLNARNIAQNLNCSVQPIFSNFKNMDDLKQDVFNYIYKYYVDYIKNVQDDETAYKMLGKNFIHFAIEEPNLFKTIFANPIKEDATKLMSNDEIFTTVLKTISKKNNYSEDEIKSFHLRMWIFTQGIAALSASQTCNFTEEEIDLLLSDEYIALKLLKNFKEENDIKNYNDYRKMEMIENEKN